MNGWSAEYSERRTAFLEKEACRVLQKRDPAGASAIFLTGLAVLSQILAFGYRVALSRMVGAEVMGLYQLLMPAYSVLLSLAAVGLTAAASNLSAQYLALENGRGWPRPGGRV